MTDQDFTVIAEILVEFKPLFKENQHRSIVSVFAKHLSDRYPRFDPEKFRRHLEAH